MDLPEEKEDPSELEPDEPGDGRIVRKRITDEDDADYMETLWDW
jgi:hypothetical protein